MEASSLHITNTEDGLFSEAEDILCPAVSLLKWTTFAYSYIYILDFTVE